MSNETELKYKPMESVSGIDITFGLQFNDFWKYFPNKKDVPNDFPNKLFLVELCENWFFIGLRDKDIDRLTPKHGIDVSLGTGTIKSLLMTREAGHNEKITGCAYLLSLWFDIEEEG